MKVRRLGAGDEEIVREVARWLKGADSIIPPGNCSSTTLRSPNPIVTGEWAVP